MVMISNFSLHLLKEKNDVLRNIVLYPLQITGYSMYSCLWKMSCQEVLKTTRYNRANRPLITRPFLITKDSFQVIRHSKKTESSLLQSHSAFRGKFNSFLGITSLIRITGHSRRLHKEIQIRNFSDPT